MALEGDVIHEHILTPKMTQNEDENAIRMMSLEQGK